MINAVEPFDCHAPLDLQANPFASNAPPPVSSAQTALNEVIRHIGLRRRAIIIAGRAGTGKTFLLKMIVRSCSDLGLSVCQFDRGDLADTTIDAQSDVVLVDEADSIPDSAVLTLLFPNPSIAATTWVFTCLPTSVDRFSCLDAGLIELRGLSVDDVQNYLLERATSIGRPDLFAPDALDLIVHRARGSPGLLLSVANLAFLTAGWGGAAQIGVRHVVYWVKSETPFGLEDRADPSRSGSGYELGVYRSNPVQGVSRFSQDRTRRLNGAKAAIAASIVFVGAVALFSLGGDDPSVEAGVTVPIVANVIAGDVRLDQTPPAAQASPARNADEAPSISAPAGKTTAALSRRTPNPGRSRVASKRSRPPTTIETARSPRAPSGTAVHHAQQAELAARQTEDAARRTAEMALQAQHAAREANDAARRADQAVRRADRAASRAERAARLANWTVRLQLPWKATMERRSAS